MQVSPIIQFTPLSLLLCLPHSTHRANRPRTSHSIHSSLRHINSPPRRIPSYMRTIVPRLNIVISKAVVKCSSADGRDVFGEVEESGYEEEGEG